MLSKEIKTIGFVSPYKKKKYVRDGFSTFNLLNEIEVEQLRGFYASLNIKISANNWQKYSTAQDTDIETAKNISNNIIKIIQNRLGKNFYDFDFPIAAFLVKPPFQVVNQKIDWHQALTYVDESKYDASMLWIALEDEEHENWAFEFITRTHFFKDIIRTAPKYPLFVGKYLQKLSKKKKIVKLKKGQAVLFSNKLLNASPENSDREVSRAIQIPLKPKEAEWLYHYYNKGKVIQYKAGKYFFLDLWINKKIDEDYLIKSFFYSFPKMNFIQFISRYLINC